MALITLLDAQLAFGHVALLDHADFSLETGQRIGLIGRNGSGKSSLLKVIAGIEKLDDGLLQQTTGLRIRYVAQEPEFDPFGTVFDAVGEGVAEARVVRDAYEARAAHTDLDPAAKGAELDDSGRAIVAVKDRNGKRATRYVVVVGQTAITFGATSAEAKVR